VSDAPRHRSGLMKWLILGLTAALAILWLALLVAFWWWLPVPSRVTLDTTDQLLVVGFSNDGSTLVTKRPLLPKQRKLGDPLAESLHSIAFPKYTGPIQLWDTRTGREKARLVEDWDYIARVAISPSGELLAVADSQPDFRQRQGSIRLWDLKTGEERAALRSRGAVCEDDTTFWFSPDGATLAWLSETSPTSLKLLDTATGRERPALVGADHVLWGFQEGGSSIVAFSPDGKELVAYVASHQDGKPGLIKVRDMTGLIKVWDSTDGAVKSTLAVDQDDKDRRWRTGDCVSALDLSPSGKILAIGSTSIHAVNNMHAGESTLRLWDIATGRERASARCSNCCRVSFSPDGKLLVTRHQIFGIKLFQVWNATTVPLSQLPFEAGSNEPVFSSDGKWMALATHFDPGLFSMLAPADPHAKSKPATAVKLVDLATRQEQTTLEATWWSSIDQPVFSPCGRLVAVSGSYLPIRGIGLNEVKVWETETGRLLGTLRGYRGPVFSRDGRTLAAAKNGAVTLWDVPLPSRAWHLAGGSVLWMLLPSIWTWKRIRGSKKPIWAGES